MSHRPRKRFGQNFLHDPGVIDRVLRAIAPRAGERLVEIGPGQGAITAGLLQAAGSLDVVELDRDLVGPLAERFAGRGELRIHNADALKFDFRPLVAGDQRLRLVGNLPYNISTPILFHLLEQPEVIADMHFMLQKEVVDRMAADPGSKRYGRLSVILQYHCAVEALFDIGPGAFRPAPKVDSAFVRLQPHAEPPVDLADPARFAALVTQAFGQRRKTLRNTLAGLLDAEQIRAAGIDPGLRAERLTLAEFGALSNAACKSQPTT